MNSAGRANAATSSARRFIGSEWQDLSGRASYAGKLGGKSRAEGKAVIRGDSGPARAGTVQVTAKTSSTVDGGGGSGSSGGSASSTSTFRLTLVTSGSGPRR